MSLKALIVGLDGGTWNVLEPLSRSGGVPSVARFMAGAWGPLESTIPPVTPPAWTSFMTGKNPGKHGVFHFMEPVPGAYHMRYTNARSRRSRTVWSLLSDAGYRVGVVNVPMTFPPEPVSGFMISGMDTPGDTSDFVHPRRLLAGIQRAVGPIRLDAQHLGFMRTDARREQVLRLLRDTDEQRLRAVLYLLEREPVDVLMVVYGSTDAVQHHFWHHADRSHWRHDPAAARVFGRAIDDVYARIDRHLGVLTRHVADDGVSMIVSDHGFGPTSSRVLYLNRWLAELGLLRYRHTSPVGVGRVLSPALRAVDAVARGMLTSDQKRRLAGRFPALRVRWEASLSGLDAIEWRETRAYCNEALTSAGTIWINLRGRQPEGIVEPGREYEDLVDFLRARLEALTDPVSGRPLVQHALRKADVYTGPHLERAPDLLLAWWEGETWETRPSVAGPPGLPVVGALTPASAGPAEWSGNHRLHGILAIQGRAIRPGTRLTGARIVDLAPTLLHFLGQPVPDDMDGRVLTEIFDAEFLRRHPVTSAHLEAEANAPDTGTYSDEEARLIQQRLQDLGYIE